MTTRRQATARNARNADFPAHNPDTILAATADAAPAPTPISRDLQYRLNGYQTESAIDAGREALQRARETLERAAEEIKRYEARYDDTRPETFGATDPLSARADVLGWALGYVASNVVGNARLDLIADAQSKLRVCAARNRDAERAEG